MITIIHWDDIVSSRKYLLDQKQQSTSQISFDGQFELEEFIQASQKNDLFLSEKKIFIENFFSKNKLNSTFTKNILEYINKNNQSFDLTFWEGKELSRSQISLLDKPVVKSFMIPKNIFLFLDSIKPGNYKISIDLFHKSSQNTEVELIFFMLQRQTRLLLSILDKKNKTPVDEVARLAPWQRGKLEKQAGLISLEKLLKSHKNLFDIEIGLKTGTLPYSLKKAIDFFLLGI